MEAVSVYNDNLLEEATSEAVAEDKTVVESLESLVKSVHGKFIAKQVQSFPKYCQYTYRINKITDDNLAKYGNKGKYTDTYGWSEDGTMKNKWVLPTEMKNFMERLVYQRFWEEDNANVRDSFMREVCRGGTIFDYEQLLKKVVLFYGTDLKETLTKIAKK